MYYARKDGLQPVSGHEAQFFETYQGYQDFSAPILQLSAAKNVLWAVRFDGSLGFTVFKMEIVEDPCQNIVLCHVVDPSGVDGSLGTFESPWASLSFAAARVLPGTTVYVLPGNYSSPVV